MNGHKPDEPLTFTLDYTTSRVREWVPHINVYRGMPCRFLEVGVLEARTSQWFLKEILTHPASRLMGVDPFDTQLENVPENDIMRRGRRNAELLALKTHKYQLNLNPSPSALREYPLSFFDLIYIDADHRAFSCLRDMCHAWELLKPTGLMIVDDYGGPEQWGDQSDAGRGYNKAYPVDNPRDAVKAFLACRPPFEIVWEAYTIGIRKLHDTGVPR